jgi:hypothetical protein
MRRSRELDEISPPYLRDQRIQLALAAGQTPQRGRPVLLEVSYALAAPQGVALPLIFEARAGTATSYQRRTFLRAPPPAITWTPRERGTYSLTLREFAHNYWWGSLQIEVT